MLVLHFHDATILRIHGKRIEKTRTPPIEITSNNQQQWELPRYFCIEKNAYPEIVETTIAETHFTTAITSYTLAYSNLSIKKIEEI